MQLLIDAEGIATDDLHANYTNVYLDKKLTPPVKI